MEKERKQEELGEALMKVALGFQLAEVTEEYAEVDGQLKLTKRKKTQKDVPPDLKAVQILLGERNAAVGQMSDSELEAERERLLSVLRSQTEGEEQVCVEKVKKTVSTAKKAASASGKKTRAKPRKRVVRKTKTEV